MFIFLPAATCYPLWGWWKSRAAGGWSDMSAPNWGLAPLTELQPCQEPIIHLHISIYAPRDGVFSQLRSGFFIKSNTCTLNYAAGARLALPPWTLGVCSSAWGAQETLPDLPTWGFWGFFWGGEYLLPPKSAIKPHFPIPSSPTLHFHYFF